MNIAAKPNWRLLQTTEPDATESWDSLLRHQVDITLPQELGAFMALKYWNEARTVLDAGCGNGYCLANLQKYFPEKNYFGVDISNELIARANDRYPSIKFAQADIVKFRPDTMFDIILMRFFAQHLKNFPKVLEVADRLLDRDGRIVIIETDLDSSHHYPELPNFTRMLEKYASVSHAHGSIKQSLLHNPQKYLDDVGPAWWVEHEARLTCAQVGPFSETQLLAVYQLWIDLCDRSGMFDFDFVSVRSELRQWATQPNCFSSIGLRVISLSRNNRRKLKH